MYHKLLLIFCLAFILCACGDDSTTEGLPDESVSENPPNTELEILNYNDQGVLRVQPNIHSKDDLIAYREQKLTEIEGILKATEEASIEKPYYPVVITMQRPVSLADMRKMLSEHNPTMAKVLRSTAVKYLPKAELVKDEDTLLISSVKFVSTAGEGQLSYETLTQEKEISKLEKQIADREKELNGVEDYQLIKGVTSVVGGIHRDSVMPIQDDPRVFLADIGPADMYEGQAEMTLWDDVYKEVEQYGNQE